MWYNKDTLIKEGKMKIVESVFGKLKENENRNDKVELEEGIVYEGDILEKLPLIEKESIDLCFTSPPYNIGKKYGGSGKEDMKDWEEYVSWSVKWIGEVYRVLKKRGFFVLNVPMSILHFKANLKTSIPIGSIFIEVCLKTGFEYYGSVVWDKGMILSSLFNRLRYDTTTTNPPLFEGFELLLFFRKNEGTRSRPEKTIEFHSPAEGINLAWGVWHITPELKNRIFHPAPFPYELAYRVITLCTAKGETVLDPFAGTGTTLLTCVQEKRGFVGIEKERKYINLFLTEYRLFKEKKKLFFS